MLQNIIFDMGNVLLTFDPEVPLARFCHSEEAKDLIRKELFQGPEWIMGDQGILRNDERYEPVRRILSSGAGAAVHLRCGGRDSYVQLDDE